MTRPRSRRRRRQYDEHVGNYRQTVYQEEKAQEEIERMEEMVEVRITQDKGKGLYVYRDGHGYYGVDDKIAIE